MINQTENNDVVNEIICNTEVLKSNLCDYNDVYILVRGDIIPVIHNNITPMAFKNCAPFIKFVTKMNGTTIDDAEDLDLVMPMCNLIEYSSNYSDTTGSGFVLKMKQLFLMLILRITIILNLSSVRLNY